MPVESTIDQNHPIVVFVRGLPGSGKSYFARALHQALGDQRVVMLDPDTSDYGSPEYLELSKSLTTEAVDQKFHPYRFLRRQAHVGIEQNKIIIWNQPFTDLDGFTKTIDNLQVYAHEYAVPLPILIVEVEADSALAYRRVTERIRSGGHGPSEATFNRRVSDYASLESLGYQTVTIDGQSDVQQSVATVLKTLREM